MYASRWREITGGHHLISWRVIWLDEEQSKSKISKSREYFSRNSSRRYFAGGTCFMSSANILCIMDFHHASWILSSHYLPHDVCYPPSNSRSLCAICEQPEPCHRLPWAVVGHAPPVQARARIWRRDVDWLIIFKVAIQERLLGVSLVDITPVFCKESEFQSLQYLRICIINSISLLIPSCHRCLRALFWIKQFHS